jgi:soluble lytic murein transglycosylase
MAEKEAGKDSNRLVLPGLFIFLLVVLVVAAGYKLTETKLRPNPRLSNLEKSLQEIRAAMNVDSVRQFNIQKIMKIINQYNEGMPSGVKYEIAEEIYDMSVKYAGLDVDLICATITLESGGTWNPEIISESGAMGLMQIMPATGIWVAYYDGITWTSPEEVLYNPIYNIRIGCRQLSAFIDLYDLEGGLAAFSGGEKKAAFWVANKKADGILPTETSKYVPQILSLYEEFKGQM